MLGGYLPHSGQNGDQRVWKPMLNFIVHLERFNKVAGTMGPTWTCTNSVIQGCSLSLLATAALSYKGNRDRTNQDKRTDDATPTVARIARLPRGFGFEARARVIETNAIPRYQFAIECGLPSEQSLGGLTSQIMRTLWPTGANMRSRDCFGSAGGGTQDRPGASLGIPDPDDVEDNATKQCNVDHTVETSVGRHAKKEGSDLGQRDWQQMPPGCLGASGGPGKARSR